MILFKKKYICIFEYIIIFIKKFSQKNKYYYVIQFFL